MTISLKVKVSNKVGIFDYTFFFGGTHVDMREDEGTIGAPEGVETELRWWMTGNPGGGMKVEVLRGGSVLYSRDPSDIPPDAAGATDAFYIKEG